MTDEEFSKKFGMDDFDVKKKLLKILGKSEDGADKDDESSMFKF